MGSACSSWSVASISTSSRMSSVGAPFRSRGEPGNVVIARVLSIEPPVPPAALPAPGGRSEVEGQRPADGGRRGASRLLARAERPLDAEPEGHDGALLAGALDS